MYQKRFLFLKSRTVIMGPKYTWLENLMQI